MPKPPRTKTTHQPRVAGQRPGSRSPKHRGYKPAEDAAAPAPKKQRWNSDERAARGKTPERPRGAQDRAPKAAEKGAERTDRRPDWSPDSGYDRKRTQRPVKPRWSSDAETTRRTPAGKAGAARTPRSDERPRRFDDRQPRPYRADRPARFEQGRHQERPRRDSSYYPDKTERPIVEDVVLERLEAAVVTAPEDVEGVTFADLGLGQNIVRELGEIGATQPFPIQAATIPDVLAGRDVLGRGRTGSGKTIAFGAPLVERLLLQQKGIKRQMGRAPKALILAPTRELALQIDRTVQPIARSVGLFTTQVYGGVPQARQVGALRRGVDIVIGTPGRIEDLEEQGHLDLSEVSVVVLDEADHMCDLGFLEPVQRILRMTKEGGQRLLFSATLDQGVASLVDEFLHDPSVHEVAGEDQASGTIDHRVLLIEQRDKRAIVAQLSKGDDRTLVFTRTRAFAEELAEELADQGIPAVSLHGDLNQAKRTRNLERLTSGRVNVLVATDVAARGIHVDDIALVIQADMPEEYKTYLHRSGRTGRAGKPGTVVTLITKQRRRKMTELLERAEISAEVQEFAVGDEL